MDGTTNKMRGLSSEETLERFVIRARRVENNSLVKSGDVERYATPKMTYSVTESGDASIQHHVCADEEAVESLATRLRPFIVKSEPIYLPKILEAIYAQVPSESLSEDETGALKTAESWFSHRYEKKDSERYGIQLMGKDGEPLTELLSDALLADAWIYTDAVHADPKGKKAEARKLSYSDRYRAASSYSCEFASVIVSLLNLVRALSKRNLLQVPDSAWSEPVSYAEADKRDQEQIVAGSAYVFPIGTEIPEGANPQDIPGARKATPAVMHRLQHPEDAAVVTSIDADRKQTGRYEAICSNEGGSLVFRIDDIGDLIVSKEAMTQGSGPIGSISFTASESHPSEAHDFLSSIAPPNVLGLEFISEGKPAAALLELSKSIESASK
ncbi:hypothetical protein QEV01_06320 [Trueperella pyogenes]|uniref:hypothetical protein n=1 Tax=Trueperella pyogenes TaxID=1661 RepID=UPI00324E4054